MEREYKKKKGGGGGGGGEERKERRRRTDSQRLSQSVADNFMIVRRCWYMVGLR